MQGVTARIILAFAVLSFTPAFAGAQVVINEVMYDPSGSDSGREWVELYNDGSSDVTMVGGTVKGSWRISDGSNHTLGDPAGGGGRGSLTVPAGGYLVISNDPTEFLSGEYAGGAYSVVKSSISLGNSGATISLIDGSGALVSSVSYASTQGGADDGSSLQRQADGTWLAASPTPGQENSSIPYVPPSTDEGSVADASSSSSSAPSGRTGANGTESSYVAPPMPDLYADAGKDRTVIVGADTQFDASAYGKDGALLDPSPIRFSWNFGDGGTAEGQAVLHDFSYPGRYAVVLDIASQRNAAYAQITVTAMAAQLHFSALPDGGAAIENDSGRDLDLSGWIVKEMPSIYAAQFTLPPLSKLLTDATMHISRQTLGFTAGSSSVLEYPNGTTALAEGESSASSAPAAPALQAQALPPPPVAILQPHAVQTAAARDDQLGPGTASSTAGLSEDAPQTSPDPPTASNASQVTSAGVGSSSKLWWLTAALLALAAAGAIAAARYFGANEWDIIEEKPE